MKTKSVLFASMAALAVGLFVPVVSADAPAAPPAAGEHRGPPSPAKMLERMKADLGLTDAQVDQLKPIIEADHQALKALREDTSLSRDDKRAKLKELREASRSKIAAILTPEQLAKLKAMRKAHEGKGPKGPPSSVGDAPPSE